MSIAFYAVRSSLHFRPPATVEATKAVAIAATADFENMSISRES
jgi:hypothetical protein